jgi:hypothetical protein
MIVGRGPRVRWVFKGDWCAKLFSRGPAKTQSVQIRTSRFGRNDSYVYFDPGFHLTPEELDECEQAADMREKVRRALYRQTRRGGVR